jgi:hypothetical protein
MFDILEGYTEEIYGYKTSEEDFLKNRFLDQITNLGYDSCIIFVNLGTLGFLVIFLIIKMALTLLAKKSYHLGFSRKTSIKVYTALKRQVFL